MLRPYANKVEYFADFFRCTVKSVECKMSCTNAKYLQALLYKILEVFVLFVCLFAQNIILKGNDQAEANHYKVCH